jgi:hypothetical protein
MPSYDLKYWISGYARVGAGRRQKQKATTPFLYVVVAEGILKSRDAEAAYGTGFRGLEERQAGRGEGGTV